MARKQKDFFISYTHADTDMARWIAWELQQAGFECVIQDRDFRPGQNFMRLMRGAIDNTRHMIAVLSPEYFESAYASLELDAALTRDPSASHANLIPVRVVDCEMDPIMRGRIYIDLVGTKKEEARRRLLYGIRAARTVGPEFDTITFDSVPGFRPRATQNPVAAAHPNSASHSNTAKLVYFGMDVGTGLDLRSQVNQIRAALKKGKNGRRMKLRPQFKFTAEDLPGILNDELPDIVHFSGTQNGGRILIRDHNGGVTTISDVVLAGLLQSYDGAVKLAIIDTCNSYRCARAAVNAVDISIGVQGKIYEDDAIRFYNVFYTALAAGRSVAAAVGQASAALRFKKVPENQIPKLCVKRGIDPNDIYFPASGG